MVESVPLWLTRQMPRPVGCSRHPVQTSDDLQTRLVTLEADKATAGTDHNDQGVASASDATRKLSLLVVIAMLIGDGTA
jgi:hypothetical protein